MAKCVKPWVSTATAVEVGHVLLAQRALDRGARLAPFGNRTSMLTFILVNGSVWERKEITGVRYRHVEEALAKALGVPSDKMGAFRGRLRHLRNIGVPHLPKPGSGRQIEYTRESAIEMLIALELGALGLAPRFVARMLEHFRDRSGAWDCLMISYRPGDDTAVVRAGAYTLDGVQSALEANYRVAIVNLAGSIAALDKSLCRQVA